MQKYTGRAVLSVGGAYVYNVVVAVGPTDDGGWGGQATPLTLQDSVDLGVGVATMRGRWQLNYAAVTVNVDVVAAEYGSFYHLTDTASSM